MVSFVPQADACPEQSNVHIGVDGKNHECLSVPKTVRSMGWNFTIAKRPSSRSNQYPFDLIQTHLIVPPII